jgi:hypothetical protein
MNIAVVVGNPKPRSRTRQSAELIAERLTGRPPDSVIDLVDLGAGLLGWGDPDVGAAVEMVMSADVLVVASPTFKATYTGLLKLFLEQFGAGLCGERLPFRSCSGPDYSTRWHLRYSCGPSSSKSGAAARRRRSICSTRNMKGLRRWLSG